MSQEEFIIQVLEDWGLSVTKIPETEEKTPDFLAIGEDCSYLIELKTKSQNPQLIQQRDSALNSGELFEEFIPMLRRNRLSGIVRSASAQLDEYNSDNSFQIVWLHAEGHSAETQMDLFEISLYGSTTLVDFSEGTSGKCYFFSNSDFHRYSNVLDAAILSTEEKVKVCLNPLSEKYEQFKDSYIYTKFKNGICDPYAKEAEGVAYIVDGDIDRKDKKKVIEYLRKKYGKEKLMDMTMNHISATVAVPHNQ